MIALLRSGVRFAAMTAFVLLVVVAVFTALLRLGLPYVSVYKEEIQAWLSDYLGTPVEIGMMELGWNGMRPHIALDDVALTADANQPVTVTLDRIDLNFKAFKSLFDGEPHINNMDIVGASLSLEYFGDSQFKITSLDQNRVSDAQNESTLDVVAWLLNAGSVGLLDSRVRLIDRERGIDYLIDHLNIRAQSQNEQHQVRIDLTLPRQLGGKLEVGLDFEGEAFDLAQTRGRFYVHSTDLKLQNWMSVWPQRKLSAAGLADVEFWGGWDGERLQHLRAKIDGNHIELAAGRRTAEHSNEPADTETLSDHPVVASLDNIVTDFTWRRQPGRWRLEIDQLDFLQRGKSSDIRSGLLQPIQQDGAQIFELSALGTQLQIDAIADVLAITNQLPGMRVLSEWATLARPAGKVSDWNFNTEIAAGAIRPIQLQAGFDKLSMFQSEQLPGLEGISGSVYLDRGEGFVEVDSVDVGIQHDKAYPEWLRLDTVQGKLDFKINPHIDFSVQEFVVKDEGFRFDLAGRAATDPAGELDYEFNAEYELDSLETLSDYVPVGVLRKRIANWLTTAPQGGHVTNGVAAVKGTGKRLPWHSENGFLEASFDVTDAALKFIPSWPALTQANGTVRFQNESMRFEVQSGKLAGVDVSDGKGTIRNFRKPVLELDAEYAGSLQTFVDFANTGPLRRILSPVFQDATAAGATQLALQTRVPLRPLRFRQADEVLFVNGSLRLADNRLAFSRYKVDLRDINGTVGFTRSGISIDALNATLLGRDIVIDAASESEGENRVTNLLLAGQLPASEFMRQYELPFADDVVGDSPWRLRLQIPHYRSGQARVRPVRMTASSNLIGTALQLPAPLEKSAAGARSFTLQATFAAGSPQQWDVRYDTVMQARLRSVPGKGLRSMSMAFGGVPLREVAGTGYRIDGRSGSLSFDGWVRAIAQLVENNKNQSNTTGGLPVHANIATPVLVVGTRSMGPARVQVNTDAGYYNAVITNQNLRGNIRIPRAVAEGSRFIRSRVSYLNHEFLQALKTKPNSDDTTALDPRRIPAIDAHIGRIELDSFQFENVGLRTQPTKSGMQITALGFADDTAQLIGEGYWNLIDPQRLNPSLDGLQKSQLELNFQSDNLGRALTSFGNNDAMAQGRGTVKALLSWSGALYRPDLATLSGKIDIDFRDGRLLSVEPGAAKLIGLFALQELPRRLAFDFDDIVSDGLDYGRITGDISLNNGVATTHLLQLDGPIGVVDVTGESNLNDRTLANQVQVLPRVSSTLPIIGLLSGGATAGIGAMLATPILKRLGIDFDRLGLTEYSISGPWSDPQIEQINP